MFALGAKGSRNEKHFINLGGEIANTCHESYHKTGNRGRIKMITHISFSGQRNMFKSSELLHSLNN